MAAMASIKQIHEYLRQGDIVQANKLADEYLSNVTMPNSIKSYLQSAPWRKQNSQPDSKYEPVTHLDQKTNLYVVAGPFNNYDELLYGLQRLSFYIAPFAHKIIILSNQKLPNTLPKCSDLDPSVPHTYLRYKNKGVFIRSEKKLINIATNQPNPEDMVILDFSADRSFISPLKSHSLSSCIKSYGVSASSRNEGSLFIQCVYDYLYSHGIHNPATRKVHSNKFIEFVDNHKDGEVALVCNGPSISKLPKIYPFTKKLKAILCNTAILNQDFKNFFEIIGLVFADPIFHFGISSYAAEFRENVINKSADSENPFTIFIPEKYAHILCFYMPGIAVEAVAIPHEKIVNFNHDLAFSFTAKTTANILTFLMLPIGASLAKTIYLFGVDGRPRRENQYFWSHDKKSQLSDDKMADIKRVHPSFFAIDYNNYYDDHVETCASYSVSLENAGYSLICCTPTHIEPFQQRMFPSEPSVTLPATKIFISINPDAGHNHGHYISHDNMLNEAFASHGYQHIVFSNVSTDLLDSVNFRVIPTFSCPGSWMLKLDRFKIDFQSEFRSSYLQIVSDPSFNGDIIVYMYMGCTKVASWICELMSELPEHLSERTNVFINCFNNIVNPKPDEIKQELSQIELLPFGRNIHLSIDSAAARQDILSLIHGKCNLLPFGIWPMIATTNYSFLMSARPRSTPESLAASDRFQTRKYSVYFPATSQRAKGVHIGLDICLSLSSSFPDNQYAIRKSSHVVDDEIAQMYEKAGKRSNITIIGSSDSDSEYLQPFLSSEVSCITYDPAFFASKTSAVLLDSVICGCKIICCKGTWLSQELCSSELSAYSLSQTQDVESYSKAIDLALSLGPDDFSKAKNFISQYSPNKLLSYLLEF